GAVTTAFADFRVYEGAQRRVGVGAALATPAFLGRAGLVVDEDGRALQLTQFTLDAIEFIAMVDGRVPVQVHPFVFIGFIRHDDHPADPFGRHLGDDHGRGQAVVYRLAARPGDRVI